ncbi:expressed unknown protein [Seminavis robusta]|uniref:Uncharacterized protein n=1 Tax=Seminavis robusta TaxID=568900 RepID=A0A9N8EEX1_9STRA|nr:expressed unknown protein [Seminavis robusta]|eukprot:Sro1052_g235811.1  (122) ;mRNA; f:29203-29568
MGSSTNDSTHSCQTVPSHKTRNRFPHFAPTHQVHLYISQVITCVPEMDTPHTCRYVRLLRKISSKAIAPLEDRSQIATLNEHNMQDRSNSLFQPLNSRSQEGCLLLCSQFFLQPSCKQELE